MHLFAALQHHRSRFVADQLPAEVTESKAEVLPVAEAPKPAPVPVKEEKIAPAAMADAPAPKPRPAPRAARTENKKQPARKAAAKNVTRAKPAKKPVVA